MVLGYGWGRLQPVSARRVIAVAAFSSLLGASLACGNGKKSRPSVRRSAPTPERVVVARKPNPEPQPVAPPAPVRAPVPARAPDEDPRPRAASFRVEGVAEDDVLNIRSQPDANARVLGAIPPQESHVEGMGAPTTVARSTWQRVRYGGVTGWVNARFLRANAGGVESGNKGSRRRAKDEGEP